MTLPGSQFRIHLKSLAVLSTLLVSPAIAQELPGPSTPRQGPNAQSGGQSAQIYLKTPEEMNPVLQTWEQKTAGIKSLKGQFVRYTYDYVFLTEKRAVGQYWFGAPDKARMDFHPDPQIVEYSKKLPAGQKLTHEVSGTTFEVSADELKSWICTGEEILELDHEPKTYSKMEIPAEYRGQRITDGPMPFLFGMKADSVKQRYAMTFGKKHSLDSQIHIVAIPMVAALRREFSRAEIMLNPKTFMPQAVKLWDPSGNQETTYIFHEPEPLNLIENNFKAPWSVTLLPPWKKIADIKADPDQLPMQEQRNAIAPGIFRTSEAESGPGVK
ncbi:hypothetical protein AB1L42_10060 [Thalassoglobus sp. JC818]|uniref:hypothetical protein n=1 Tax=Thalassoglobus sp. JC818 TaxID=3232136 RepID=UPI00345891D9